MDYLESMLRGVEEVMQSFRQSAENRKKEKEREKAEFEDRIDSAIVEFRENAEYSTEFYQQLKQLIMDLYECIGEFTDKMLEKYEDKMDEMDDYSSYDVSSVNADSYDSGCYDYERQSQAKVACKKALKEALDKLCQNYEEAKEYFLRQYMQMNSDFSGDVEKFIQDFQDSYADYVSLDCEDEAEGYAEEIKSRVTSKQKISQMFTELDIEGKYRIVIEKLFNSPLREALNVQEYLEMCEYDEEDDFYCYNLETAVDELNDRVPNLYVEACEQLSDEITDLYQAVLIEFEIRLRTSLLEMIPIF